MNKAVAFEKTTNVVVQANQRKRSFRMALSRFPIVGKLALGFLILIHLLVFASPLFYHQSPTAVDPLHVVQSASSLHWLGTDELGRDELARLLSGGKITLTVGVTSMTLAVLIGGFMGAVAGFFGGITETIVMRIVDTLLAIPSFFLILIEITSFGHNPPVLIIVVGLTYWPQIARVVYAEFLKWRNSSLVEAEVTIGAGPWRILFRHILPQTISSIIVLITLGIGWSILAESGLSYLGLGIQPPIASWGNMLQNSQSYIWTGPVLALYPGILIFLTVLAYSLLGESLRDAFDPKLKNK